MPFFHMGGGGGDPKLKNVQNVMGSPKNALNFFSDYTPFDQVRGGGVGVGVLNFEWPYRQEYSFDLLQIVICCRAHLGHR